MKNKLMTIGNVFNIQRYSIHDGPGIRTIIFLKGCPLHCYWCSNPESQKTEKQLLYHNKRCKLCGRCIEKCPNKVLSFVEGNMTIEKKDCDKCGICEEICFENAWEIIGESKTVQEIVKIVERDRAYYDSSGGGVTLSGGEPLMQWEFSSDILSTCKKKGINTAIETTGFLIWEKAWEVFKYTDYILMDIKHMDSGKHKEATGVPNELTLENAKKLKENGKNLIIRVPIIPGFNDSAENISQTAIFAKEIGVEQVHLLPYHRLGENKYKSLFINYTLSGVKAPSKDHMAELRDVVLEQGVHVIIGG